MSETPDLAVAVETLANRVQELAQKTALSEQSQRELRAHQVEIQAQAKQQAKNVADIAKTNAWQGRAIKFGAGIIVALLIGSFILWHVAVTANHATDAVKENAVTSCQNANQRTAGQRLLWNTLIGKSLELNREAGASKKDIQYLIDLQSLEQSLFQKRDCSDPGRKYPLPPVPSSLRTKEPS